MASPFDKSAFRQEPADDLTGNILPFWMAQVVDREHGGFYNAYLLTAQEPVPQAAQRCQSYVKSHMVDRTHGDWAKQLSPMAQWMTACTKQVPGNALTIIAGPA